MQTIEMSLWLFILWVIITAIVWLLFLIAMYFICKILEKERKNDDEHKSKHKR